VLLGFALFFAIYGCIRLVRRSFYGEANSEKSIVGGRSS
jgi:hypothetical protein